MRRVTCVLYVYETYYNSERGVKWVFPPFLSIHCDIINTG